jgi:hypothetical protein
MPLGLTMRPAARIIKDLPPLTNFVAYRVLFSSAPSSVKSYYRAEYGRCGGEKKPLEQTPVRKHPFGGRYPSTGSESDLTVFTFTWFSHLANEFYNKLLCGCQHAH